MEHAFILVMLEVNLHVAFGSVYFEQTLKAYRLVVTRFLLGRVTYFLLFMVC